MEHIRHIITHPGKPNKPNRKATQTTMITKEREDSRNEKAKNIPVGLTCDLRTMRHTTINIRRFCKILSDSNSSNLMGNQIEQNRKKLKRNEIKKKRGKRI